MNVSNRKAKLVGLITIIIICLIILFVISRIFSYVSKPKEIVQNTDVKEDNFNLNINGDYLIYVRVNEKYNEEGAKAYLDKQNISDDIIVSYYKNDSQVSSIDTSAVGTYTVKYEITNDGVYKDKTRVVIVTDDKAPNLSVPDAVTITTDEVASYDVESGVRVSDNSGEASFSCDNILLPVPDDYIVTCTARDKNGNKTIRKRLIKVVSGIEFKYDNGLTIEYPSDNKKNYTYKYSLDNGKTWLDASIEQKVDIKSGNVIALVLEDNNYKMSSTYYIK